MKGPYIPDRNLVVPSRRTYTPPRDNIPNGAPLLPPPLLHPTDRLDVPSGALEVDRAHICCCLLALDEEVARRWQGKEEVLEEEEVEDCGG